MSQIITDAKFYGKPPCHLIVRMNSSVFTFPVEPYDPPIPQDDLLNNPDFLFSFQPFHFHCNLERYPQFAFIPKGIQFIGPLLGHLSCFKVIQGDKGHYGMEPKILASWIWLEDTLSAAISSLAAGSLLPMQIQFYDYPQQLGYKRSFKGRGHAAKVMHMARETFIIMISLLSMFYSFQAECHFHHTCFSASQSCDSVQTLLKKETTLSDSIIQDLIDMHALLGTRVGLLVDVGSCAWFEQYRLALTYARVSFVSNLRSQIPQTFFLSNYISNHDTLGRYVSFLAKNDWPSISSNQLLMIDRRRVEENAVEVYQDIPAPDPQPVPNHQHPSEMPQNFLKRHTEEEKIKRQGASPEDL